MLNVVMKLKSVVGKIQMFVVNDLPKNNKRKIKQYLTRKSFL